MHRKLLLVAFLYSLAIAPCSLASSAFAQVFDGKKDSKLSWTSFDEKKYEKQKFAQPTVVAIMKDLCPGCRAKRDALWENPDVIAAVRRRNILLFNGNAQTDEGLEEMIKTKFSVSRLPVVLIRGSAMSAKTIILDGIPDPKQVLAALDKHLPIKQEKQKVTEK